MYARIAVNVPQVTGLFDYHLPAELAESIQPGCLVVVPFGAQTVQGIVLARLPEAQVAGTRPVLALLDPQPVLTPQQMELAQQMAEQTLSPLAVWLHLMLPPGLSQQADTLYGLAGRPAGEEPPQEGLQARLLARLQARGEQRGRQLEAAFPRQNWKSAIQALIRRGWVLSRLVLPSPSVRPKTIRMVHLAVSPPVAEAAMPELGRDAALARRQAMLRFLIQEPWPVAAPWLYAVSGGNLADLKALANKDLIVISESEVWRDPLENVVPAPNEPPPLTAAQQSVWEALRPALQFSASQQPDRPFLLHGVTGSGKTEIYLQAVAETLKAGRQAIVLVPEIALTPQTVRRFMGRFPGQVGLVHSRLSAGERYDTWRRARAGLLPLIVGPRSALFTPLPNLGLIIIDEAHDETYYQSEPPCYSTVQAARRYARLSHSVLLLGTATPDVELLYRAQHEGWPVLRLPERILAHRQVVQAQFSQLGLTAPALAGDETTASLPLPPVEVVDMRQELKAGNRSIFSRSLQQALEDVLQARQQAILFLNRVGSATYVFCRECGFVLRCPRCDLPLAYHGGAKALVCHTCHYQRALPAHCPQCGSVHIRQYGSGTERVEQEVQKLFPQAGVLRWDSETAARKGAHEVLLSHFINHRADILIGTQMLAKGLDLPLVTLVGVVLADVGLNFPDFRAAERSFQLLTQVAGRAGRSALGGRVILQTFQPQHYVIQAAARHDFDGFYQQELVNRRHLRYPPFYRLLRLEYRHLDASQAEAEARRLAAQIRHWLEEGAHQATEMIGPVPCFFGRVNGYYRWQMILRGPDPQAVVRGRSLGDWRVEADPPSLL